MFAASATVNEPDARTRQQPTRVLFAAAVVVVDVRFSVVLNAAAVFGCAAVVDVGSHWTHARQFHCNGQTLLLKAAGDQGVGELT